MPDVSTDQLRFELPLRAWGNARDRELPRTLRLTHGAGAWSLYLGLAIEGERADAAVRLGAADVYELIRALEEIGERLRTSLASGLERYADALERADDLAATRHAVATEHTAQEHANEAAVLQAELERLGLDPLDPDELSP